VLDVGSGEGAHAELFASHGKQVTAIDYGKSVYFERGRGRAWGRGRGRVQAIVADFNTHEFERTFECVWASHVLEHQVNVGVFLSRVIGACAEGGVLALTVPPLKHEIVGGHVTLWNAGLMLYVLAVAGLDVREAAVCRYGYNISVIVRKRTARDEVVLAYDKGDVDRLRGRLPSFAREGFDGDVALWRWPGLERLGAAELEGVAR
jgi:SAM-dependent methyltransferase